eukprot:6324031-Prymnesium_polylepis.1
MSLDPDELVRAEVDGEVVEFDAICESVLKDKATCKIVLVPFPWSESAPSYDTKPPAETPNAAMLKKEAAMQKEAPKPPPQPPKPPPPKPPPAQPPADAAAAPDNA